MSRLWDLIAVIVVSFFWDVVDRGGRWARMTGDEDD